MKQLVLGAKVYPKPTEEAIEAAMEKFRQDKKLTKSDRVLLLLRDGEWHEASEMAEKVSWRFGGYLHELKKRGVNWEKERVPNVKDAQVFRYRLAEE